VLKFDKYGNFLLGWGMKGSGPGQFDTPHSIAIDGDVVYVGDRENARIQLFDLSGRFLREWKLGHPYGLSITGDQGERFPVAGHSARPVASGMGRCNAGSLRALPVPLGSVGERQKKMNRTGCSLR